MDIRIIKKDDITLGHIPNVVQIIELPFNRVRIVGRKNCETCGHTEEIIYDTEQSDTIMLLPTLRHKMNETECGACTFHVIYWDEIDGELFHDGCICNIDKEEHLNNCSDYDNEFKGCSYFQED